MAKTRLPAHTSVLTIGRREDGALVINEVGFAEDIEVDGEQIGEFRHTDEQAEQQRQINRQAEHCQPQRPGVSPEWHGGFANVVAAAYAGGAPSRYTGTDQEGYFGLLPRTTSK